jgi:hypothetical protein
VFFTFQIYGDFSGYSDIAIGTSRLFGFDLMQNFNFPYFSRDIAEFWRRWHISLSTWFRDYLYISLGGSRGGKWKSIRNVFIIFIVSGFWHGANWTFIVWGGLNAIYFLPLLLTKNNRSNDSYNFASFGEHYYFTYQKLNKIISSKSHKIQKIVLGVSVHNFGPIFNRLFDLDFPEGQASLRRYLYFIDLDERTFIKDRRKLFSKALIEGIYLKLDWGGFYKSNSENPDSLIIMEGLKRHYKKVASERRYSTEQIKYLHQIDSLCKLNNINLYLVSTPYHPLYKKNIAPYYFDNFKKVLDNIKNTRHINYLDCQIDPDLMADGTHLNYKGSEFFSKMINENINIDRGKVANQNGNGDFNAQ